MFSQMLLKDRKTGTQTNAEEKITCAVEVENRHTIHTQVKKKLLQQIRSHPSPSGQMPTILQTIFSDEFPQMKSALYLD